MSTEVDPHELILSVQTRKLLYDKTHKLYGNRNFTNNAWREVAEEIGTDELSARRKWSALRDYFTRQYRVVQAGAGPPKKIRWCFYNNLLFLRDFLDPKPNSSSSSAKFDYDSACAEDMESASIINADHIKSNALSDEDSVPFDALGEEQPQSSTYQTNVIRKSWRKRSYAVAHADDNSNNDVNGEDDENTSQSLHYDNSTGGRSGIHNIISNSFQESSSNVEEDHDDLFLKSLLPDLKCVSDEICKMECKIEIQGVILKFIRQSRNMSYTNSNNQTDSSSDTTL